MTKEGPKLANIQYGVKPDIFKKAAQKKAKIFGGVKSQHFWASSSAKKVLLTAEKVGSAQKRPKFNMV